MFVITIDGHRKRHHTDSKWLPLTKRTQRNWSLFLSATDWLNWLPIVFFSSFIISIYSCGTAWFPSPSFTVLIVFFPFLWGAAASAYAILLGKTLCVELFRTCHDPAGVHSSSCEAHDLGSHGSSLRTQKSVVWLWRWRAFFLVFLSLLFLTSYALFNVKGLVFE